MTNDGRGKTPRRTGIVLGAVNRFTAWLYAMLAGGFFGRILTAYDREETAAFNGFGGGLRRRMKTFARVTGTLRRRIAGALETSRILKFWHGLREELLGCALSVYGVLFALYGCYTLVLSLVFEEAAQMDFGRLVTGITFVAVSLPMFFSGKSLAEALGSSRISHWLLVGICGISEDSLKIRPKTSGARYIVAVAFAVISGCLTAFVHPLTVPAVIFVAALVVMVLYQPEMGAVLTLFVCPFLSFFTHPTLYLVCCICVTAVGYLIKLVSGRRVFRFGLLEGMIVFFVILVLFGGFVTAGGRASLHSALVETVMIAGGFFLVYNLARTRVWLRRCSIAFVSSCTIVSVIGIWQRFFADLDSKWLDMTMFSGIGGRVTSVFSNPNMLAVFLVLVFPVALAFILTQRRLIKGFFLSVCGLCILACTVLTWSRGAWVGTIVAVLLMLFLISNKTLSVMLLGGIPLFAVGEYAASLLSGISLFDNVTNRFASIGNLSDSSTLYRVYTWKGVGAMVRDRLFSGIGVGESAFTEVYPLYALSGIESVMHSHSLYLEILSELGLIGLIVFCICMFLFLQKCLGSFRTAPDARMRLMVIAGLCGILGAMVIGIADYIWYNYSVCFLFWALIGLTSAYVDAGKEETERSFLPTENSPGGAELTLKF